jgi:rubredoxin
MYQPRCKLCFLHLKPELGMEIGGIQCVNFWYCPKCGVMYHFQNRGTIDE